MGKRKKHIMNYRCCEGCSLRPESLYKACEFGWHVFGSGPDRDICIFARYDKKETEPLEETQRTMQEEDKQLGCGL